MVLGRYLMAEYLDPEGNGPDRSLPVSLGRLSLPRLRIPM